MNEEIDHKLGIIWQDVQHRRIVKIINEINSGLHVNFDSIFNQLTYYIEDHFETEEQYMHEYDYDKIDSHSKEHKDFKNKFKEISEACFADDSLNTTISSFLNEWFHKHIFEVDNELAVFLLKHEPDMPGN
jgi:hemerythrin-like metal-binding protein